MNRRPMFHNATAIRVQAMANTLCDHANRAGGSYSGVERIVEHVADLKHYCESHGLNWSTVLADAAELHRREAEETAMIGAAA